MLYYPSSSKTVKWNFFFQWQTDDSLRLESLAGLQLNGPKSAEDSYLSIPQLTFVIVTLNENGYFNFIGTDLLLLLLLLRKEQRPSSGNWPPWVTCGLWQFPRVLSGSRTQQRWTRSKTLNPGNATPQPLLPAPLASAKNVTMPTDSAWWAHALQHAHPITHGLETRMETKPEEEMIMWHLNILSVVLRSKIGTLLN